MPSSPVAEVSTELDLDPESPEAWWREVQPWLKENGYTLRPRYTPGWVPSWKDKSGTVYREDYEDGQVNIHFQILDAFASDGRHVCLKKITAQGNSRESTIMQLLSAPPLKDDPLNHSIPLEKVLNVPGDDNTALLVIPLLRPWTSPPLETIGEGVEFIRQLFEGMHFLHKRGIAHRDIKWNNVMMDASTMYPEGFHFVDQDRTVDFSRRARYFSRTEKPPRYYIIDFGQAKQYELSNASPMDMPAPCGDGTVPEYQGERASRPSNPFKVDIYCTGNILRWYFTEGHSTSTGVLFYPKSGFDFLKPLVADMVQDDPSKRPTMEEVVQRYEKLRKTLTTRKLRTRLAEKREGQLVGLVRNIPHWSRTARYIVRGLPATPLV